MTDRENTKIYALLAQVKDPEIPVLSLVDLGVITSVNVKGEDVEVEMTPTFVGCPAIDMMQSDIRAVLLENGYKNVSVTVSYKKPWTSDMISERGKKMLREFGLAPPPPRKLFFDLDIIGTAECPRCGHSNTALKNSFGPTLCRSIHYCNDCQEAFEQFKPL